MFADEMDYMPLWMNDSIITILHTEREILKCLATCNICLCLYRTSLSKKCPLIINRAKSLKLLYSHGASTIWLPCDTLGPFFSLIMESQWANTGVLEAAHDVRDNHKQGQQCLIQRQALFAADISSPTAFLSPTAGIHAARLTLRKSERKERKMEISPEQAQTC